MELVTISGSSQQSSKNNKVWGSGQVGKAFCMFSLAIWCSRNISALFYCLQFSMVKRNIKLWFLTISSGSSTEYDTDVIYGRNVPSACEMLEPDEMETNYRAAVDSDDFLVATDSLRDRCWAIPVNDVSQRITTVQKRGVQEGGHMFLWG